MNRSIAKKARCLRLNAGLPKQFWAEAVNMAVYLINKSPQISLEGKIAEEIWTGVDIDISNLKIFGCPTSVLIPSDKRSKLDSESKKCIFLGFEKGIKGFKLWDHEARKRVISQDVVFDEQYMLQQAMIDRVPVTIEVDTSSELAEEDQEEGSNNTTRPEAEDNELSPKVEKSSKVEQKSGQKNRQKSGQKKANGSLAANREPRIIKAPVRYGFEEMAMHSQLVQMIIIIFVRLSIA
ncbi:Retrovirus-related Pol polyprotein from transposon TNT 1-94 [Cardamine amara subsp. amara]|uniref:Retrovirus-related Pol polyprotein from transposon TNT 1-94 n=1 Tax=Cardamine amara subsp. amara TaxID=228776 RepID=A0ABD1AJU9_CARAN